MKILDNINHTVREDLQDTMQKGSRVSIAAACFSIYAYQELKKQLERNFTFRRTQSAHSFASAFWVSSFRKRTSNSVP